MQKISVIIPCYNAERYLDETLNSVLSQTRKPQEVIVINDGSTDQTERIASKFDKHIKLISQKNQGECAARNRGMDACSGDWIAFIDADDIWFPTKLEKQSEEIESHGCVCIHTGFKLFGTKTDIPLVPLAVKNNDYSVQTLILDPLVNTSTAMVRSNIDLRFPVWAKQGGDMLYFAMLSKYGNFRYVHDVLVGYRMHESQVTRNSDSWVLHFKNRYKWVTDNPCRLSDFEKKRIFESLNSQVLHWMQLALWSRDWERYWSLRKYAYSLRWGRKLPKELRKKPYPRVVYRLKDYIERKVGTVFRLG